jgi:AMP nucleosidase
MQSIQSPPSIATESFSDAGLAVARLEEIYERNTKFLRDRFEAYVNGEAITTRVRAFYPFVRVTTATHARLDSRLAYGFVARPGVHETSVTRPDLFRTYLTEQIGLLIQNHGVPVEIGESGEPIPVHFAYRRDINIEAAITTSENFAVAGSLRDAFDVPDLATMDDAIADGTFELQPGAPEPLSLFRAARVDYSLRRLYHYTGTDPEYFQNFVIFTNYQFYVDAFAQLCQQRLQSGEAGFEAFVAPGNVLTRSGGAMTGVAPAPDAGLSPGRARLSRHHPDQHRHRPVQRAQRHRPRGRAAAPCLADARPLRGPAQHAAARRLRPCAWLRA